MANRSHPHPLDYCTIGEKDECWPWLGRLSEEGYGHAYVGKRRWPAHRLVYLIVHGDMPNNAHIDHLCRNRACVNPAHLEAVSPRVNILRGEGAAAKHARKTACPKCGGAFSNITERGRARRRCKRCQSEAVRRWKLAHA